MMLCSLLGLIYFCGIAPSKSSRTGSHRVSSVLCRFHWLIVSSYYSYHHKSCNLFLLQISFSRTEVAANYVSLKE